MLEDFYPDFFLSGSGEAGSDTIQSNKHQPKHNCIDGISIEQVLFKAPSVLDTPTTTLIKTTDWKMCSVVISWHTIMLFFFFFLND